MNILMVCLGNICRSPLAQGIMEMYLEEKGLDWKVDSAGTGSWHIGEKPDRRSIQIAQKHDIDISLQRGRQFTMADFDHFDLILVMDASNYNDVVRLAPNDSAKEKVQLILNYAFPNSNRAVPDPYFDNGFEEVYGLLNLAIDNIVNLYGLCPTELISN